MKQILIMNKQISNLKQTNLKQTNTNTNTEGENAYFCEKYQRKIDATKRCCIKKLSDTLIVHLKRFECKKERERKREREKEREREREREKERKKKCKREINIIDKYK